MLKTFVNLVTLAGMVVTASHAQGLPDQLNFSRSNIEGPHIYGVSINSAYSTYDFRSANGTSSTGLPARTSYGASVTAGWQRFHGKTNFSVRYTGGYNGNSYITRRDSFQHSLYATMTRTLGRKWTFNLSASGLIADLSQSIFEPSNLVLLAQSGAAFDDLAASQSIGQFSSAQNGLILSGGAGTPATRAILLGNRVPAYNLDVGLSYAHSSRLTFSIGSFALGGQQRSNDPVKNVMQVYNMPRTIGGMANVSMSYSLSPRTSLSLGVAQTYTSTRYQKNMGTSPQVGLGRKMGKHWFLRGTAGAFVTENNRQSVGAPPRTQATWGGALGFQTRSHAFLASYDRSGQMIADAASTVGRNTIYRGAWSWHPNRRGWAFHANYSHTGTGGSGFVTLSESQAGAGLNRNLGWNLKLSFNYAYLISNLNYFGLGNQVSINSGRVSLGWTPRLHRERQGVLDDDQ
ncbi:MAG: hypothetical protein ABI806_03335 [Candidatus Solibacter sp.]